MLWDVYGRVIDNHGDLGVCWRFAADLASRGETVRLCIDDVAALAWMAPQGCAGVTLHPAAGAPGAPGDVVVETFGCGVPEPVLAGFRRPKPPLWIDLEYLSAEAWVGRSHGLPSPQWHGAAAGLTRWFYFPGFDTDSGGLLREPGLAQRRAGFDAAAWRAARGIVPEAGERIVSLFCYGNAALPDLLDGLASAPTLLLLTPGFATEQAEAALGPGLRRGALRALPLPWLTQADYDHLLGSCDLNFVRGEDSLVRAVWAAAPFVWQAYPQQDGAQVPKIEAVLDRSMAGAPAPLRAAVAGLWRGWNGLAPMPVAWPDAAAWAAQARRWSDAQRALPDLVTRLLGFVAEKR